jgi:hypothetical protein
VTGREAPKKLRLDLQTTTEPRSGVALYQPRLDATKRRGERHRNLEDFDSITERPQNHNPGLIHTIRCSRTGSRRARTRGPQRDLLHESSKNKEEQGCARHSAAWLRQTICGYQFILIKTQFSVVHRGIYTRNNPPRWVETRKQTE